MENCIRCKRKYGLFVPLRPVSFKKMDKYGKTVTNLTYVCACGCTFQKSKISG